LESACAFILRAGSRTLSIWNSCVSSVHHNLNWWSFYRVFNNVMVGTQRLKDCRTCNTTLKCNERFCIESWIRIRTFSGPMGKILITSVD
jgi:hypothetical protein